MWGKHLSQWVIHVINPIKVILCSKSIESETLTPYRLEGWMCLDISYFISVYAKLQVSIGIKKEIQMSQ